VTQTPMLACLASLPAWLCTYIPLMEGGETHGISHRIRSGITPAGRLARSGEGGKGGIRIFPDFPAEEGSGRLGKADLFCPRGKAGAGQAAASACWQGLCEHAQCPTPAMGHGYQRQRSAGEVYCTFPSRKAVTIPRHCQGDGKERESQFVFREEADWNFPGDVLVCCMSGIES